MQLVWRIHSFIVMALAVIAGAIVMGVCLAITYDVALRTMRLQPPYWTSAYIEYALLYITLLASPWLARRKGHVFVQLVGQALPAAARVHLERLVYVICIAICLVICVFSTVAAHDVFVRGEVDVRSVILPAWILYAPMPVAFLLLAVEFSRFLLGHDSMYRDRRTSVESM